MLGRALDRHQQRQQALAVLRARVFLQGLAERQMLRLGRRRKPRRVGRQKRERRLLVLPVFGQIEMHATDEVPGGLTALEELLHRQLGFAQFGIERRIHASPKIGEHSRRQVFRAGHGRDGRCHPVQRAVGRKGHRRLCAALANAGKRAQRGHVVRPELPPIRQYRRQRRPDLVNAQTQQSVPRAPCEGPLEPSAPLGVQRQRLSACPRASASRVA